MLQLTGGTAVFADLIGAGLRRRLAMAGRDPAAAEDALGLLGSMPAFIDAPAAMERLRGDGLRLGVLTQSVPEAADAVLRFAGLRDRLELVVSAPRRARSSPTRGPTAWRSSARAPSRRRWRSSPRTGGTSPAPRRPGCARAGSRGATS